MSDNPKNLKKLTDSAIAKMTGNRLRDTEITGLVVNVRKTGKYFYLEYKSPVTSTYRKHPLGKFGNITTQQARELARIAAGQIAQGTDPQEVKQQQRAANERKKMETLRAFLETGYREITPPKTADEVTPVILKHFADYVSVRQNPSTQNNSPPGY